MSRVKKRIIKFVSVIFILVFLCGCGKKDENTAASTQNYLTTEPENTVVYSYHTEEVIISAPETNVTVMQVPQTITLSELPTKEVYSQQNIESSNIPAVEKETEETVEGTTEKVYQKTGEMEFSDKPDNKFIKAVADKYNVDSKNLVAIYTVPENDGNMVLQFDGSKDNNGKLIKNKTTLIAIYTIDKNLNAKRASEDKNLNEYSYIERKAIFITTIEYILPEFETELNG